MSATKGHLRQRLRPLFLLALPTLLLLPLVLASTFWHVHTRVRVEIATARLAFTPGGTESHEILNRSVPFSSLVVEDCGTVTFSAEHLEVADPQLVVPGVEAGEVPRFPDSAWSAVSSPGSVKLPCLDPDAKLTLQSTAGSARVGVLDRIRFEPDSPVVLEVSPGGQPALGIEIGEIGTPQTLSLALGPDLEFVTDFVKPEGVAVPFAGDLLTWRARLPESRRMLEIAGGAHGMVLIVTPMPDQAAQLFRDPLDLPLASMELLEEDEGAVRSALRDKVTISYPDYPAAPAATVEKDEALSLGGLSQARLRSLAFDAAAGTLRARFDGFVDRAASRSGDFAPRDHRLTRFDVFRYSWRWSLFAAAAAWLASTTLAAFGAWKKIQEPGAGAKS